MNRLPLAAVVFVSAGIPVLAQSVDPKQFMDELLRQKQIEMRQQFQDRQRQRQLDQQERAQDREFCVATNSARPSVEQCVRDLAEWRRSGWRPPEHPSEPIDYSAFGTPVLASRADIPLTSSGGTFAVPVVINGAIALEFAVHSGATDVFIPLDVYSTLKRTGTINDSDVLGQKTYVLADGSKSQLTTFRIRSLKVGDGSTT
jgi:hypothetical protein